MNILSIDTSTNVLGVGLASDEKIIGEYITNIKRNHSTRVMPAIKYLLNDTDIKMHDIDKIVVAGGPGSYTGLRIGVTIAKTLAWSLNIPLSGVSSLKLMASSARHFEGVISPVMDARRGNIFTGLYVYKNGSIEQLVEDQHISSSEWASKLKKYNKRVLFIGSDSAVHQEVYFSELGDQAVFSAITENLLRPGELALLGKNLPNEDVHSFIPNYLRLAEAEAKWREKTGI